MSDGGIHVSHNRDLKKLEKLLSGVRRPGDFFVEASFETALPRVEVAGAGTLSFPVPGAQVRQIIAQATRRALCPERGDDSRRVGAQGLATTAGRRAFARGVCRQRCAGQAGVALPARVQPGGPAFTGLKGEDATLAKVLRRAAEAADCAVHLGIVHIEETGPAEPDNSDYDGGWYDEGPNEDAAFEAVEVSESTWHVGGWHDTEDHPVDFGNVPLDVGEVLPAGALDGEEPDEQRLMEATGNEGMSFERSYHRAALVLWPRERFADGLLQAGVTAVLPYFAERVVACDGAAGKVAPRRPVLALARRVLSGWIITGMSARRKTRTAPGCLLP